MTTENAQKSDRATRAAARRLNPLVRAQQLLDSAETVLLEVGFAAFSLRQVAANADVRLATLQYYYNTREALLTATILRALDRWQSGLEAVAILSPQPPIDRLRDMLRLNLDYVFDDPSAPLLLETFALARHEEFAHKLLREAYLTYRRLIADLLQTIQPSLPAQETFAFATVVAAQMEGMLVFSDPDDPVRDSRDTLRQAVDRFCHSIVIALNMTGPAAKR